jgi:hypothetical protein
VFTRLHSHACTNTLLHYTAPHAMTPKCLQELINMQARYEQLLAAKESAFKREVESMTNQFVKTVASCNQSSNNSTTTTQIRGASLLASHSVHVCTCRSMCAAMHAVLHCMLYAVYCMLQCAPWPLLLQFGLLHLSVTCALAHAWRCIDCILCCPIGCIRS